MSDTPETFRFTFTVTPLTVAEAQAVIDDIRARFGRKPLIHVIGRQPATSSVWDAEKLPTAPRNQVSGQVTGMVIQAGDIVGGVQL
jgi:hypothetical protein